MKRLFLFLVLLFFVPATASAQELAFLQVGANPVNGGTDGQCLTISSGRLGSGSCGGGGGGLTVGTTTVGSGTNGYLLYNNAGVLGNLPTTTFAVVTGSLTPGNVANINSSGTGIVDSNLTLISNLGANVLLGNNSSSTGPISQLTFLTMGDGTCSAQPTYSFAADPTVGMTRITGAADSVSLCAKGFEVVRAQSVASSVSALRIQNSIEGGQILLQPSGGTNIGIQLNSIGTGTLSFSQAGVAKGNFGTSHSGSWTWLAQSWFTAGIISGTSSQITSPGEIALNKITASGSSTGATGAAIWAQCGTNAGTAKLMTKAGTSATAVLIVDNIGAGVTGC